MNSFCPLPWNSIFINHNGSQKFCCHSQTISNKITDFNHDIIKKIRLQILNGSLPDSCNHCKIADNDGSISPRQEAIKEFNKLTKNHAESVTDSFGISSEPPTSFSIILGNQCNLQCMMCSPDVSSSWNKENWIDIACKQNNLFENTNILPLIKQDFINRSNVFEWYKDQNYFDTILSSIKKSALKNKIRIWFSGGEVFTNKYLKSFLKELESLSENIQLEILTNGTSIPKEIRSEILKFENIKIHFSIDGIGPKNDYIRYPSKFSVIEKNLNQMKQFFGKIHITISSVNMFDIDQIINWCEERQLKTQFNFVYGPMRTLCSLSLPKEIRTIAANKLESLKVKYTRQEDIDQIINSFKRGTLFSCSLQDFTNVIKEFDLRRGTSLIKTFPEWNRILGNSYELKFLPPTPKSIRIS